MRGAGFDRPATGGAGVAAPNEQLKHHQSQKRMETESWRLGGRHHDAGNN